MKVIGEEGQANKKILTLDKNEFEEKYYVDIHVDFIPYVGTITKKYFKGISYRDGYKKTDLETVTKEIA